MSDTPPDETTTVLDVVDTLEELLASGRRVPFTTNVVVNEEDILELVDRIRVALPDDFMAARHTVEEREQLLERAARDAHQLSERADRDVAELTARTAEEADRLLREARAQAAQLVDQHAIVEAATERARALVADAEQHAATERTEADAYARDVMGRLAEQLERWLGTVREGLVALPDQEPDKRRRRR